MITTSCVRVRGVCVCVVWRISVLSVVPPTMFASPEYNVRLFIAVDIVVDGFDGVRARVACHNRLGKCDYPKYGFGRNNFVCVELWSCVWYEIFILHSFISTFRSHAKKIKYINVRLAVLSTVIAHIYNNNFNFFLVVVVGVVVVYLCVLLQSFPLSCRQTANELNCCRSL